jgi:hypothetical protein
MDAALARLNGTIDASGNELPEFALAIKADKRHDQRHTGIIYRDRATPGAPPILLHLERHHRLTSGEVPRGYHWIDPPGIHPVLAVLFARLCSKIANNYGPGGRLLEYAFRYDDGRFDKTTGALASANGKGLTCATFVLAVFASYAFPLLRVEEWQEREGDREWREKIIGWMKGCMDEAHLAAIRDESNTGCARFRPEEVVAASASRDRPAGFAYSEELGKRIVEKLEG